MVSHSIAYGSLVSVSLLSLDEGVSSFPLSSLSDECATRFGFESMCKSADEAGNFFIMATVNPSCKDLKNGVCLSAELHYRMGCPLLGRTVLVQPLKVHSSTEKENNQAHCPATSILLESCKDLCLFPLCSLGKIKMERTVASHSNLPPESTCIPSEFQLLARDNASNSMLALAHALGDDSSRKLLERCAVLWLMSRCLLLGNFVTIQMLSGLCLFQVVDAKALSLSSKIRQNDDISDSQLGNHMSLFSVNRDTKVRFLHPSHHTDETSSRLPFAPREFRSESQSSVSWNLRKVGGLSKEFDILKDIIVSSAAQVTTNRLRLRPTKGVLLHGPPGTGKTTLAQTCAHEAGIELFTINGPGIISQYHGETEQALREVFDKAEKFSPAVVFIDELDAIAPARRDGGDDLSRRMVATLLMLMDGVSRTDGVLIIAATNRPDSIEPALKRPGRLDREIEIGVPFPEQRYEILMSILSEMNHSLSEKDIQDIAMSTHGFVGADLAALCNEAAFIRLRKYVETTSSGGQSKFKLPTFGDSAFNWSSTQNVSTEDDHYGLQASEDVVDSNMMMEFPDSCSSVMLSASDIKNDAELNGHCSQHDKLKIIPADFEKARVRIRPSAMREVILEVPRVSWEDVGGQMEVKTQLMEAVQWPQKHKEAFERIGTRPPKGILLFGPQDAVKPFLARAVASEARLNFLAVKGPELFSKWVGESEKAVRSLFAKARMNAPSIIFFDEIDGLAITRGKEDDGVSVGDRVITQLLVEMDGLQERGSVTVVAATNRPDKIDPAILRPGRFDRLLYVGLPNRRDREDIFRVHLRKMPCSSDVSTHELSHLTEGCTGADISYICSQAALRALEEDLSASEIKMEHLKAGIQQVQPTDVQMYKTLSSKFQRFVHSIATDDPTLAEPSSSSTPTSFWTRMQSIAMSLLHPIR